MSELEKSISGFRKRVRWLQAWRWLAICGTFGASISVVLAALDFFRVVYFEWWMLAIPVGVGLLTGAIYGLFRSVNTQSLADSIDRRAGLANRLGTAAEQRADGLRDAQRVDALAHVVGLKPSAVFPVRVTKWHSGVVAGMVLTASLFLLGNTPILMNDQDKADRAELKKVGETVERVARPEVNKKEEETTPEARELAKKLEKFGRELQKGRTPKEEAMQKANDLAKEAEKVEQNMFDQSQQSLSKAQEALNQMALEKAMKESGLSPEDMKGMDQQELEQMSQQSDEQLKSQADALSKMMSDLERKLQSGKNDKGEAMSKSDMDALKTKLNAAKKSMKAIELSQKVKDMLRRLTQMPEFKEIMELMKKLAQTTQKAKAGQPQELTKEQIEEIQKKLEELADKLKDDKAMKEFLQKMLDALKRAKGLCNCQGMMPGFARLVPMWGPSGPGQDNFYRNIGQIPVNAKGEDIKAKADAKMIKGERQEGGEETYIEIKGPSGLGERSKTPYYKVLSKYRKQAEDALDKDKIPKEHQARVKNYFESLNKGK